MAINLIISILIFLAGMNQSDFYFEKEYAICSHYFSTDQFKNIYIINKSLINKINSENNTKINYSNNLFGDITSIDVSDPFRILIFNKDFNKILFLDNTLSEISSPIILDNLQYFNVTAVCQSNNGGFWIYDQNLNQIVYFDKNLKETKKSAQISSLLEYNDINNEVFMLEKNDYIYLGIYNEGILQFNNYGTYIKTFPIKDCTQFQVKDGYIIYSKNNKLFFYNTSNFETEKIDLPLNSFINARIENNLVFIQTTESIKLFKRIR